MKENEITEIDKKTNLKKIIIGFIVYLLFFLVNYIYHTNNTFAEGSAEKKYLQIILGIIGIVIYAIFLLTKKFKFKTHITFLIIASFVGIVYFLTIPLGNGNDEVSHYLRIFEISEKYTSSSFKDDSKFPEQFKLLLSYQNDRGIKYKHYKSNYSQFNMNTGKEENLLDYYWNIKLYSPIQYLPQVVGVTLGRLLSDNILFIGNCGRIFGYIFWMLICAYAIKIVPNKKTFFTILCLLPINIISAVCLSGDTVTNAVCILFIAILYKKIYTKEEMSLKDNILIIGLSCMIALCKIVYLPFVCLTLLLEKDKFKKKSTYIVFLILAIVVSSIIGLVWLGISGDTLTVANSGSKEQIKFILENPFTYIIIMLRTMFSSGHVNIFQLTTGYELLCHGQITAHGIVSYIIGIVCLISLLINEEESELEINNIKKTLVYLIIFGTIVLMVTALYIQWTSLFEIGRHVILGIQGRYFIPIVALIIFVTGKIKIVNLNKNSLINVILAMQVPMFCQLLCYFL